MTPLSWKCMMTPGFSRLSPLVSMSRQAVMTGMKRICAKRGIGASDDALATIASRADGSVRDALSILEQCAAAGDKELSRASVLEYTGAAGEDFFLALTGAVIDGEAGKALVYIDEIIKRGKDARQILKDWLRHMRDLMIVKYVGKAERIVGSSGENISRLRAQAELTDAAFIEKAIRLISLRLWSAPNREVNMWLDVLTMLDKN